MDDPTVPFCALISFLLFILRAATWLGQKGGEVAAPIVANATNERGITVAQYHNDVPKEIAHRLNLARTSFVQGQPSAAIWNYRSAARAGEQLAPPSALRVQTLIQQGLFEGFIGRVAR